MSAGEAIAIGFAAGSAFTLLITLVMLIKASRRRITVAATVLGIGREEAALLDKEGRLSGALGISQLAVMSPHALGVLQELRKQETG